MDIRNRNSTKINKPLLQKQTEPKWSVKEAKCISDLKKLYLETIHLDVKFQRDIYDLEKSFEKRHNEIYDKRMQILQNFTGQNKGGDEGELNNINKFWLKVLKDSYTEFISKSDEKILMYLTDIRSKICKEPDDNKFIIEFYFLPNEYFTNRILTKTYYRSCTPDPLAPLTYEGSEIHKCEGCKINWKKAEKEKEKDKKTFTSFFDFFDPPELPENEDDPDYADIRAILENDFELGFYLKERVIPKAVLFFTGDISDYMSSDSETDSEDDDDDNDDDGSAELDAAHAVQAE